MMPRFFKDMPTPKPGRWRAVVIRRTLWSGRESWSMAFNGRLRAYIAARIMALWEDFTEPNDEIGIDWAVSEL